MCCISVVVAISIFIFNSVNLLDGGLCVHALADASDLFKSLLHSLISCCSVGLVLSRCL